MGDISPYVKSQYSEFSVPEFNEATPAQIKAAFLDLFRCTTCGGKGRSRFEVVFVGDLSDLDPIHEAYLCPDCVDGWDNEMVERLIDAWTDADIPHYLTREELRRWLAALEAEPLEEGD